MIGLFCDKTYRAMTNYKDGDDDVNENCNAAYGSGSDGTIRSNGPIRSRRIGLAEEDWSTMTTVLRPRFTIYLCVALYIYHINTILNM